MHIAMLLGRMAYTPKELYRIFPVVKKWALHDHYTFTRVAALQACFDLSRHHPALEEEVRTIITTMIKKASPAIASRCRKLLAQYA